jgi:NAD(P)-dependent dehydrogenase (short-subunit alcohol dehydrogenase family)
MRAVIFGRSRQIGIAMAGALVRAGAQVTAVMRGGRALPAALAGLGVRQADG